MRSAGRVHMCGTKGELKRGMPSSAPTRPATEVSTATGLRKKVRVKEAPDATLDNLDEGGEMSRGSNNTKIELFRRGSLPSSLGGRTPSNGSSRREVGRQRAQTGKFHTKL